MYATGRLLHTVVVSRPRSVLAASPELFVLLLDIVESGFDKSFGSCRLDEGTKVSVFDFFLSTHDLLDTGELVLDVGLENFVLCEFKLNYEMKFAGCLSQVSLTVCELSPMIFRCMK